MRILSYWGNIITLSIFVIFLSFSHTISAQNRDIGIGLGGLSYTGDLQHQYRIVENRPAGEIFYRHTFSNALSLRGAIMGGMLQASDQKPVDDFAAARNASFDIILLEGAITLEYHFLDFLNSKSWVNYSPYFFGGVGVFTFFGDEDKGNTYRKIQPVIPFGIGMKYLLDEYWQLGIEFGARKTFFDYLDNISGHDPNFDKKGQNYQYGNQYDKDWYYFLGLSISYTFYQVPCPFNTN